MDLGTQQEPSLTMPNISMKYGSIHESSKFRMLGGTSVHTSGMSPNILNGQTLFHSSPAAAQLIRPPLAAPPATPSPPAITPAKSPAQLVEESSTPASSTAGPVGAAATSNMGGSITADGVDANFKKPLIKYRECLKNHAANIGGHALDGCGEFMPSGEEGSLEALKCGACGCHRNFHRRELEGELAAIAGCSSGFCTYGPRLQLHSTKDIHDSSSRRFPPLEASQVQPGRPRPTPLALPPPSASPAVNIGPPGSLAPLHMQAHLRSPPDMTGDLHDQSPDPSSFLHINISHPMLSIHHHQFVSSSSSCLKKRFRTKFSPEQKDRMFNFAEKLGWRIQKHDDSAVHQFCAEVGVKRHVFKVWMHNNKSTFAKKISSPNDQGVTFLENGGSSPTTSSGMQP